MPTVESLPYVGFLNYHGDLIGTHSYYLHRSDKESEAQRHPQDNSQ